MTPGRLPLPRASRAHCMPAARPQCRVPIQPAELVMKIATVYASTSAGGEDGHAKLLVV